MKTVKNIVITGASSGLGAALARHYAAPGIYLHLQGRNRERIETVAENCKSRGAHVSCKLLDVTDADAMQSWLEGIDRAMPVDLIIANAGISAGTGGISESSAQARRIFAVNIDGVVNSIQPLLPAMMARRAGQIALIGSLAGLRGLPSCPAYSASKGWVRLYGEGLRGALKQYGIRVSVICPGYIDTPMTQCNDFPMPFLMPADKAAARIAKALARNASRYAFPWPLYLPLWWLTCLPTRLTDGFFARLPAKPSGVE